MEDIVVEVMVDVMVVAAEGVVVVVVADVVIAVVVVVDEVALEVCKILFFFCYSCVLYLKFTINK